MVVEGKIIKSGHFFVAEISFLELRTESKDRKKLPDLFLDAIEDLYGFDKTAYSFVFTSEHQFILTSDDSKKMLPLILTGLRNNANLSVQEVADKMNFKSRSSYFKYETGERNVSFDQFEKIVAAITGSKVLFSLVKD